MSLSKNPTSSSVFARQENVIIVKPTKKEDFDDLLQCIYVEYLEHKRHLRHAAELEEKKR